MNACVSGKWLMGRDAGRAFTYLTPAVRDYRYFYLGVADTLTQVTFHVRACHDALILLKSAVSVHCPASVHAAHGIRCQTHP